MVVVAHVCEALQLFPWMGWGLQDSAGHYLDLASAVLGSRCFPSAICGTRLSSERNSAVSSTIVNLSLQFSQGEHDGMAVKLNVLGPINYQLNDVCILAKQMQPVSKVECFRRPLSSNGLL
jgi:hypothetical protein